MLTFDEVLTNALVKSPLVSQIDSTLAARVAEAINIETLPNAELSVGAVAPRSTTGEKSQYSGSLSQTLKLSYLGARQEVAKLLQQTSSLEAQVAIVALTQEIRRTYVALWEAQQREIILREALQRAKKMVSTISEGRRRGLFGIAEESMFQAQQARSEADLIQAQADRQSFEAEIVRLSTVVPSDRPLQSPEQLVAPNLDSMLNDAQSGALPLQKRIELLAALAKKKAILANEDAFPPITPQLTYSRNEDGVNFYGGGFSIEIPFTNRNQGARLQSASELKAALAQSQYIQGGQFTAYLSLLSKSLQAGLERARLYKDRVVPQLERTVEDFERRFRLGQASETAVWQAQMELVAAQETATRSWLELAESYGEIAILTGRNV